MADTYQQIANAEPVAEERDKSIVTGQFDKRIGASVIIRGLPTDVTGEYFTQMIIGLETIYGKSTVLEGGFTIRDTYAARITSLGSDKPVMVKASFLKGMVKLRELDMILVDVSIEDITIINDLTSLRRAFFQVHQTNKEDDTLPSDYTLGRGWDLVGDESPEELHVYKWKDFIERRNNSADRMVPWKILDGYIANKHTMKDADFSFIFTKGQCFIVRDGVAFNCNDSSNYATIPSAYSLMFYLMGIGSMKGNALGTGKELEYRMRYFNMWQQRRMEGAYRWNYDKFNKFRDVDIPLSVEGAPGVRDVVYGEDVSVLPVDLLNLLNDTPAPLADRAEPPSDTNTSAESEKYLEIISKYKYVYSYSDSLLIHIFANQDNGINVFISEEGLKLVYLKVPPSLVDTVSEYIETLGWLKDKYRLKGPDVEGYYYIRSEIEEDGNMMRNLFKWLTAGESLASKRMIFYIDLPKWPLTASNVYDSNFNRFPIDIDTAIDEANTMLHKQGGYDFGARIPEDIGEKFYRADGTHYTVRELDLSFPIIEKTITRLHRDGISPVSFPAKEGFTLASPEEVYTSGTFMSRNDAIVEIRNLMSPLFSKYDDFDLMAEDIASNEPDRAWKVVNTLYPGETNLVAGVRKAIDED